MPRNPARTRESTIARVRETLTDRGMALHLEWLAGERLDPKSCAICAVIAERQFAATSKTRASEPDGEGHA